MLSLNKPQKFASEHKDGPMMVLAGPGSGKTTVITHRIQNMIYKHKINPSEILVITFTKAAADEMKTRFNRMSPEIDNVSFGTFHSFFFRVVKGVYGYSTDNVLRDDSRHEILRSIVMKLMKVDDEEIIQNLSTEISLVKNEQAELQYYNSSNMGTEMFKDMFRMYEHRKEELEKIEFDDMLKKFHDNFANDIRTLNKCRRKYKYILIDEFQDINYVQYKCIKLLAEPLYNIFVVGDDDQSVYRFRGARPEFLLRFPKDYENTQRIILNVNYRSTDRIIKASGLVINENKNRYEKEIVGTNRSGGRLRMLTSEDISQEAVTVSDIIAKEQYMLDEVAVIYRTNIQARAFADVFRDLKIPYRIKEEVPGIYEHWIAKDICSYIRLALDRKSDADAARIINRPSRYIKNDTIKLAKNLKRGVIYALKHMDVLPHWQVGKIDELIFYLDSIARRNTHDAFKYIRQAVQYDDYIKDYTAYRKMDSKALFEILDELQESAKVHTNLKEYLAYVEEAAVRDKKVSAKDQNGVTLTTMHGAKGMEFETVFVTGLVEGVVPHEKSRTQAEIEEERRLLYVGMTRAKENLYLSLTRTRYDKDVTQTRFIAPLRKKLK